MKFPWLAATLLAFLLAAPEGRGEDWMQFRGGNATGIYPGEVPARWGDSENLKWVIPLNGKGVSSPIVVGERIFVTTFSGFAQDVNNPGDLSQLRRNLTCIDRKTGKVLWQQFVGAESGPTEWGSGASPMVYNDMLLVNACDETQALIAFDCSSGEERWRAEAQLLEGSYSTPIVGASPDGQDEIIIPLADEIWGIDPTTGKLKWWVTESLGKYICTTPVVGDGVVYVAASSKIIAVRLGGRGDVTNTHTLWSRNAGPGVPSPILDQGKLYWVGTNGILTCADASSGKTLWRKRIGEGSRNITYASLTKAANVWLSLSTMTIKSVLKKWRSPPCQSSYKR